MKIQNEVTPWIQHLENILKLSIERQHNETSQLYKYILVCYKELCLDVQIAQGQKRLSIGHFLHGSTGF